MGFCLAEAQSDRYLVLFTDSLEIIEKYPISQDSNKFIITEISFNRKPTWASYSRTAKPQLSKLATDRREKLHIKLESSDYFVMPGFMDSLSKYPIHIIRPSRWLNGVLVVISDTDVLNKISKLEFVKSALFLGKLPDDYTPASFDPGNIQTKTEESSDFQRAYFDKEHINPRIQGFAYEQLKMIFDSLVDETPYQKVDFPIAVIDAGFRNVNLIPCFKHLFRNNLIQGTYDFSSNDSMVFDDDDHGTKVLSCLAGYDQGNFSGSAPNSKFWLLRSEETASETLAEEVLWCLAAEYADSVGCGLITSSLGYNYFDNTEHNHSYEEMDGEHTIIAKAIKIAASKGITVISSSGNEGDKTWHYITTPGDSKYALTLGACNKKGEYAYFSSIGPSSDGRTKPDVVTLGYETVVCSPMGNYTQANGSSFSTPLMAGFVAHLKQDFPLIADSILFDAIRFSSSQASQPNNKMGYGIPNYMAAKKLLSFYQSSDYTGIIWSISKTNNDFEIRKLNDGKTVRVLLKSGTKILNQFDVQNSFHLFNTYKLTFSKRLKKGKKYTLEFIDENKKTLLVSNLIVHQ